MGLNATLATAGSSLETFGIGIQVAGQNIANAATPGYIREELLLEPNMPVSLGQLILGSGVTAASIQQQIDTYLEQRIYAARADYQASSSLQAVYYNLESEIRELGDDDLSTSLNRFLDAINEAINQPESGSLRHLVVEQGSQLAADIAALRANVDRLREQQSDRVTLLVDEANRLIDSIAELNPQISQMEANGLMQSDAGGLRTQRYNRLAELSEIIPVRFAEQDDGSFDVFSGANTLILAGEKQYLETYTDVDNGVGVTRVRMAITGADIPASGGELRGIIDARDRVLGDFVDELDTFASNLIFEFNRIHSSGEGLRGFEAVTAETRMLDQTAALNAAGLDFTPTHGSFQLKVTSQLSDVTTTSNIAIDLDGIGTDTSLQDLRDTLNAVDNITATITTTGRLKIVADDQFEFCFADDTSGVLASLGINTFFTGSNSASIGVNSIVANDHEFFAASLGGGPSDGSNAVRLAQFSDNSVDGLSGVSLSSFYDSTITSVAQSSAREAAVAEGLDSFLQSLLSQREQFSGVSLDEEAIKMLEFQHAFRAAARVVSTIDELFTVLLNM